MTIGEKLKKSRNDKGMSLRELATKVDLSASFLSQIEQGKASPSIENLKKIAHTLDVRVAYLIEDEEDDIRNIEHIKKENIRYIESLDSNIKMGILLSNNREKILLKKLEDWAEEHIGDWYPYWEQSDDKFYIYYFHNTESFCVGSDWNCNTFNKLPYFKSEELAREFIEEFGDEIKEVLL